MEPLYEPDIWKLLTRILSGEADSSEELQLKQWLEKDPANRAFFEDLKVRWQEEPDQNGAYRSFLFDRESGVSRLRHKIRNEKENKESPVAPPPLTSSNRFTGWKIAASILLLIGIISAWAGIHLWSQPVTSYETSNVEQRIITLPDGSTIRMNRNSRISFRKGLKGATRKVSLQGEAFFQVTHDADKPFIIHAGDAVIRDIGTSFNVKQGSDGKIVVAMKEGRVTLRAQNTSSKGRSMLTKNDIGILEKGHVATMKQKNIQNYLSWIQGRLVFKNMRLDKVIRQLDHIYGISSQLADSSLATLHLTAYTQNTSLGEVLDMIALSLDLTYRKEGQQVIWRTKRTRTTTQPQNITDTTVTKD